MKVEPPQYLYTANELADDLGVPASTFYKAINLGVLSPFARSRRQILFQKQDVPEIVQAISRFLSAPKYFRTLLIADRLASADPAEIGAHEVQVAMAAAGNESEQFLEKPATGRVVPSPSDPGQKLEARKSA